MNSITSIIKEIKLCRKQINIWKAKETTSTEEKREQQRQITSFYKAIQRQAQLLTDLATRELKSEEELHEVLEPIPKSNQAVQLSFF